MEVRRRRVHDVCQHREVSTIRALPTNPEGRVPRRRAELVNVVEYIAVDWVGAGVGCAEGGALECGA